MSELQPHNSKLEATRCNMMLMETHFQNVKFHHVFALASVFPWEWFVWCSTISLAPGCWFYDFEYLILNSWSKCSNVKGEIAWNLSLSEQFSFSGWRNKPMIHKIEICLVDFNATYEWGWQTQHCLGMCRERIFELFSTILWPRISWRR